MITRLYNLSRSALALFGAATLVSLLWFHAVLWFEAHADRPRYQGVPVSPVAQKLAARVAPGLQDAARDYEPTFLHNAGGPVTRWAAGVVYPVVVDEIPRGTEVGCDHLLSHFGSLSLTELVEMVVDHATSKGRTVHESLLFHSR